MNKNHHVGNAAFVGIALAYVASADIASLPWSVAAIVPPVILGALIPDLDHIVGKHRKTGHNLFLLAGLAIYPALFGNLSFVWVGVAVHFLLDLVTARGLALFYPLSGKEWSVPPDIPVDSRAAGAVTGLLTIVEILIVVLAAEHGIVLEAYYGVPHL